MADITANSHPRPREGKTERDKKNGHVAGKKNRRIWVEDSRTKIGEWVKA